MNRFRVQQVRLPIDADPDALLSAAAAKLRVSPSQIRTLSIERRAIDARKKPHISFVYTLQVTLEDASKYLRKHLPSGVRVVRDAPYIFPHTKSGSCGISPVIIGRT